VRQYSSRIRLNNEIAVKLSPSNLGYPELGYFAKEIGESGPSDIAYLLYSVAFRSQACLKHTDPNSIRFWRIEPIPGILCELFTTEGTAREISKSVIGRGDDQTRPFSQRHQDNYHPCLSTFTFFITPNSPPQVPTLAPAPRDGLLHTNPSDIPHNWCSRPPPHLLWLIRLSQGAPAYPHSRKLTFQHPVSAPLKPKVVRDASAESSSDEDDEPTVDMVSSDDAWMFPIGGSVMLVGLYVLFKYLNKDYLNYLFTAYFGVIGIFAVSNVLFPAKVDES